MIRASLPGEEDTILAVVTASFSDGTRDASEERAIVRGTWAAAARTERVELVADQNGQLVGHVLAAPGRLDGAAVLAAGVAPVCVAPDRQGRGVGRVLMEGLLSEAEARGWPLLLLLGDPSFYSRFGFEHAGPLGITYEPAGPDSPHFLARRLPGYEAGLRGSFTYCWE